MLRNYVKLSAALFAILVSIIVAVLVLTPRGAVVATQEWERLINIETFELRHYGTWWTPPADAENRWCEVRQSGTRWVTIGENRYPVPQYDDWCEYDAWRWEYDRTIRTSGERQPYWAEVALEPDEREVSRVALYWLELDIGIRCHFTEDDYDRWAGFREGDEILLVRYPFLTNGRCYVERTNPHANTDL